VGATLPARLSYADNLSAAQLSRTRTDGSTLTITDFTTSGANRGAVPTAQGSFDFSANVQVDLQVSASFEGSADADDYSKATAATTSSSGTSARTTSWATARPLRLHGAQPAAGGDPI
jgi:type 1 fimbria pilin